MLATSVPTGLGFLLIWLVPESPRYTANNFGIMNSRKRIGQNSFPNFIYIFPESFMIFCQELQDPKKELRKPDLNLVSQGCHHEKIIYFTPWI
jgi:hypothetical protein